MSQSLGRKLRKNSDGTYRVDDANATTADVFVERDVAVYEAFWTCVGHPGRDIRHHHGPGDQLRHGLVGDVYRVRVQYHAHFKVRYLCSDSMLKKSWLQVTPVALYEHV